MPKKKQKPFTPDPFMTAMKEALAKGIEAYMKQFDEMTIKIMYPAIDADKYAQFKKLLEEKKIKFPHLKDELDKLDFGPQLPVSLNMAQNVSTAIDQFRAMTSRGFKLNLIEGRYE